MNTQRLRLITVLIVLLVIVIGFVANLSIGTLSAIGWQDIVVLCPLGALGTMLATKLIIPQAVISLVFAVLFIIVFGRAFCSWICPVPLVSRVRTLFSKDANKPTVATAVPSEEEQKSLSMCSKEQGCNSCAHKKEKLDSRHLVLGGSLLSAALFGFPVFCLICPIGLTFASIFLVIRLFALGDVTWSLLVVPALLIVEVVLFKKWCGKICPLSAFMSLIGKLNTTFKPRIDDKRCLETAQGKRCGICAKVCPETINPRHPEEGASWSECTKCRICVEACPVQAITMPPLAVKKKNEPVSSNTAKESRHDE